MASVYDPLRGFAVKHAFAKSVHKGEDAWSQKREVAAPAADAGPELLGTAHECAAV